MANKRKMLATIICIQLNLCVSVLNKKMCGQLRAVSFTREKRAASRIRDRNGSVGGEEAASFVPQAQFGTATVALGEIGVGHHYFRWLGVLTSVVVKDSNRNNPGYSRRG